MLYVANYSTGGGTGTVTSVSVVTANGISGSVATSTTTPAITLTLGAITPSSVAAVGTVTGSNLSGTNTGDNATNTQYSGLAASKEDVSNKSTTTTLGSSNTLYPTQNAVKTYVDTMVAGLLDYRGGYDASVNVFPSTGGSGTAGAVLKGDMWIISVAGTLGGSAVQIGDSLIASVDTPGQTAGNWNILNANISYVPEDVANKSTDGTLAANSTTLYPSQSAVKTYADTKALLAGSTSQSFAVSQLEIGHASDTTLARVSAGVASIEGNNIVVNTSSPTLGTITTTGNIELGNASDTTLSRSAAGDLAVEGVSVLTTSNTKTVTGKRIQPRTASSTTTSNLSPDLSTANVYFRTTQTATLTIDAPTGTPVIGETIMIYVDSAGAQTLTINATYKAFGAAFPATTTAGKTFMLSAQFNGTDWKSLWANAI